MRVGIVTLGCDKNTVDAEYLAGLLAEAGCEAVAIDASEPSAATLDAAVVISCGFIADAREQSVMAVVELAERKQQIGRLYLAGCLSQKHARELAESIPQIDGIVGVGQLEELARMILQGESSIHVNAKPHVEVTRPMPRRALEVKPYSFLKIADGCDHKCSFCAIPQMKGPYRSTPPEILLDEARELIRSGVRELNLVAQDITQYGMDLQEKYRLPDLLRDICRIDGEFWVRCLYAYPGGITDELMRTIKSEPKIVKYLDVPLQHFDPDILRSMRRPFLETQAEDVVDALREAIPGIVLRTSLIIGYPGEDPRTHEAMLSWLHQIRFERLGAFTFSREPGTPAAKLKQQVPKEELQERYDAVMETQAQISSQWMQTRVGEVIPVLIEGYDESREQWIGRGYGEAPEVDGVIYVESRDALIVGDFATVRIERAEVYDAVGKAVTHIE